jgi:hypothetical protein
MKELPCKLVAPEWHDSASALAGAVQAITTEEDRQVNIKSQLKAALAELEAKKNKLAATVNAGVEYREVTVNLVADWGRGQASEVRTDTGEVIGTPRMLTDAERQPSLPVDDDTE